MICIKKGQAFKAMTAAAVLGGVMAGCGGSGSSLTGGLTIDIYGTARSIPAEAKSTVTPSDSTSLSGDFFAPETDRTSNVYARVPSLTPIQSGDHVAMVDSRAILIPGMKARQGLGGGTILIDDADGKLKVSGLRLDEDGSVVDLGVRSAGVSRAIGDGLYTLSPRTRPYKFRILGPLEIVSGGKKLIVKQYAQMSIPVQLFDGKAVAGVPIVVSGQVPANLGSTTGLSLAFTVPGNFISRTETFTFTSSNGTLFQSRVTGSNAASQDKTVTFNDAVNGNPSLIPGSGIDFCEWTLEPMP